ncbi:22623_t:CDS:2 [Cetraspora pellucida]|uniref:tRNA:m(4)X modification enzyme TRM13 n=1 Tax=Cetraspora pellucida TaxID=1433469 RepID=A0A9N9FYI3_9GLOM|nr:22623_t:CDS:2 [Cetraspora pellucida]
MQFTSTTESTLFLDVNPLHLSLLRKKKLHMERLKLLQPDGCFIKFSCGKDDGVRFLFIDRKNTHDKFDTGIREDKSSTNKESLVLRIGIDIKDLDLSQLDFVKDKKIITYSKHLCGSLCKTISDPYYWNNYCTVLSSAVKTDDDKSFVKTLGYKCKRILDYANLALMAVPKKRLTSQNINYFKNLHEKKNHSRLKLLLLFFSTKFLHSIECNKGIPTVH